MSSSLNPSRDATGVNDAARTLWLGVALTSVGGFLDAFTYVGPGHVFANAMSGNIVLTALAVQSGDWAHAARGLSALAAFMVGVIVANALRLPHVSRVIRQPHITALTVEMALLVAIGAAPGGIPDSAIVLSVTFVAAVQTSTFRQLGDWPFTSTMTTGNLRSLADSLLEWTTARRQVDVRKMVHFGAVFLAFCAGAFVGGVTTLYWGERSVWVVSLVVLLCVVLVAQGMRKQSRRMHITAPAGATT